MSVSLFLFLQDWQGKQPGFKGKWYEALVEDITVDLIEGSEIIFMDLFVVKAIKMYH